MRTLLIIEDDHDTRVALREAFEGAGFSVFSTANGREGLKILPNLASPVLVLLDQNMPLMSGDDFLRKKLQIPELAPIPVIVISAVADRTHQLGVNGFMPKPLDLDLLIRTVSSYFSKGSGTPPAAPLAGTATMLAAPAKEAGGRMSAFRSWIDVALPSPKPGIA